MKMFDSDIINFSDIIKEIEKDSELYISNCEKAVDDQINQAVLYAVDKNSKVILLSGPSASGKTTTANKICSALRNIGKNGIVVSIDNFFKNVESIPKLEDGRHDYDSLNTVDIEYLAVCFKKLKKNGFAKFPIFDFISGHRSDKVENVTLLKDDIIIIEGLHALNPKIEEALGDLEDIRIYISIRSSIYVDDDFTFSPIDIRMIRRVIRDYNFRGSSVFNTLDMWKGVCEAEKLYIHPFSGLADIKINSILPYELAIYKDVYIPLVGQVNDDCFNCERVKTISEVLVKLPCLPNSVVPKGSIIHEIIG